MAEPDEFDLDRAEAEVVRSDFRFRWGGQPWTLRNAFKLPADLIAEAMGGDLDIIVKAMREGMGAGQYDRFTAAKRVNLDAAKALFIRWTDHAGLDEGESSGSDGSSASTAEPSKPTSTATTASDSGRHFMPSTGGTGTPPAN